MNEQEKMEGFIFQGERVIISIRDGKAVSVMALGPRRETPATIRVFLQQALGLLDSQEAVLRAEAYNKLSDAEKAKQKEIENGKAGSPTGSSEGSQVRLDGEG